jgi:hypothetical protein
MQRTVLFSIIISTNKGKKMNKKVLVFSIACLTLSGNAFAVGTTGCGLGSEIFERNSLVSQSFAATTNITGIAYSLTTGTTAPSSNCKVDGIVMNDEKKIYYVEANLNHLEEEMAQGKGENLAAFAEMFNCGEQTVTLEEMTRSQYRAIFPSQNTKPADVLKSVEFEIQANPILSKSCFFIG